MNRPLWMITLGVILSVVLVAQTAAGDGTCVGDGCAEPGGGLNLLMVKNRRSVLNVATDEESPDRLDEEKESTEDVALEELTSSEAGRPKCDNPNDPPKVYEVSPRSGSIAGGQRLIIKGCNLLPAHSHVGSSLQSPVQISMMLGSTDTGLKCDLDGFKSFGGNVTCITRPINGDPALTNLIGKKLEVKVKLLQPDDSYEELNCSHRRYCNMEFRYGAQHRDRFTLGPTPELTSVSDFLVAPGDSVELFASGCNSTVWKDAIELRPVGKIKGVIDDDDNSTNSTDAVSSVGDPAHAWVCEPESVPPAPPPANGLTATYYKVPRAMWQRIKNSRNRNCDWVNFDGLAADRKKYLVKQQIDVMYNTPQVYHSSVWPGLTVENDFAAVWQGFLNIDKDDKYKFRIDCDDNCDLQINDQIVVKKYCDGGWKEAEVQLNKGKHAVVVRFQERSGRSFMALQYRPPRADWMAMPNEMLEPLFWDDSLETEDIKMVRILGAQTSGDRDCPGGSYKMKLSWKCRLPEDIPAQTFYDIYFKDHMFGNSIIREGARIPPMMGGEEAVIKVVPKVSEVLKSDDGLKLTVLGHGLDSSNMSLSLGGNPCSISIHTQDLIECVLNTPAGAQSVLADTTTTTTQQGELPVYSLDGYHHFDGKTCLDAVKGSDADLPLNGESYTIEAWVKPSVRNHAGCIVSWGSNNRRNEVNALRFSGRTSLANTWWRNDLDIRMDDLRDGKWHHIAATYDGRKREIIVDFVVKGSRTARNNRVRTTNNFCVGSLFNRSRDFFQGEMKDVKIWKKVRTVEDMKPKVDSGAGLLSASSFFAGARGFKRETYSLMRCKWQCQHGTCLLQHEDGSKLQVDDNFRFSEMGRVVQKQVDRASRLSNPTPTGACLHAERLTGLWSPKYNGSYRLKMAWDGQVKARLFVMTNGHWNEVGSSHRSREATSQWIDLSTIEGQEVPIRLEYVYMPKFRGSNTFKELKIESRQMAVPSGVTNPLPHEEQKVCAVFKEYSLKYDFAVPASGASSISFGSQSASVNSPDDVASAVAQLFGNKCTVQGAAPSVAIGFEPVGTTEHVQQVLQSAGYDRKFGKNTGIAAGSAACGLGSLHVDGSTASWPGAMTPIPNAPGGKVKLGEASHLSFCYKIPNSTVANMVLKIRAGRRDDYVSIPLTYLPEPAVPGVPAFNKWPSCTKRGAQVAINNDGSWHCTSMDLMSMFIDRYQDFEKRIRGIDYRKKARLADGIRNAFVTEIGFHAPNIEFGNRKVNHMPGMQGEFWIDEISFSPKARDVAPVAAPPINAPTLSRIAGIKMGTVSSGSGLQAEFYGPSQVRSDCLWPDFSKLTPAMSRVDDKVYYKNTWRTWAGLPYPNRRSFAAQWNGKIKITSPGMYNFRLYSDERARMFFETQAPSLPPVPAGHVPATAVQMGTSADFVLSAKVQSSECDAHIMSKHWQVGNIPGLWKKSHYSAGKLLFISRCKICLDIGWVGKKCGRTRVNDNKEREVRLSYNVGSSSYTLTVADKEEFVWKVDARRVGPDDDKSRFDIGIDISNRVRNGKLFRPWLRGKPWQEAPQFYLKNKKTQQCVHTQRRWASRGTRLVYWPGCSGRKNALIFQNASGDAFYIQNAQSGRCVHTEGSQAGNNGGLRYWDGCGGEKNKFRKVDAVDGTFYIQNLQKSENCISGATSRRGARLKYVNSCSAETNKFAIVDAGIMRKGVKVTEIKYNNQIVEAPLPPSIPVLRDEQGAVARGGAMWLTEVVSDESCHGWNRRRPASGSKKMTEGMHGLLIQYLNLRSHAGIQLQYNGPDTNGRWIDVPASILSYGSSRADGRKVVPVEIIGNRPADASVIKTLLDSSKLTGTARGILIEEPALQTALPTTNIIKVESSGSPGGSTVGGNEVNLDSDKYAQMSQILGGATVTKSVSAFGSECFQVEFAAHGDQPPIRLFGDEVASSKADELKQGIATFSDVNDFLFRQPQSSAPLSLMQDWRNFVCTSSDGCIPKETAPESLQQIHASLLQRLPPVVSGKPQAQAIRRNPHSHRKWSGLQKEMTTNDLDSLRKRVVGESATFTGNGTLMHVMSLLQQAGGGRTHHSHRRATPYPPSPDPRSPAVTKLRWSSKATWGGQNPPTSADLDLLYIPEGRTLLLDVPHIDIRFWVIEGNLIWDDTMDIKMEAEAIVINGGGFYIGSESKPYSMKGEIVLNGHWHSPKLPICGMKTIFQTEGFVEMHGIPVHYTWTSLHQTAQASDSSLVLMDPVDWVAGDHLVIAPTDKAVHNCRSDRLDDCQIEEAKVIKVEKDMPSEGLATVQLDGPLKYRHVAEEIMGPSGEVIQIRAEVGKLNRNIKVRGSQPLQGRTKYEIEENAPLGPPGAEAYGGHMMLTDVGIIKYVEFNYMGQAFQMGRYPVHFHLSSLNPHSKAVGNAVWRTFNRAFTVHGIHKLTVERNVAYNTLGHTYFLEDGNEHDNVFADNLGMLTLPSFSLLASDMTPATFWTTNPHNTWVRNHAAGSHTFGFWFDLFGGVGHGAQSTQHVQLKQFENNTAHNNGDTGVWVGGMAEGGHDPRFGCVPTTWDFTWVTGCGNRKRVYQEHFGTLTYMNKGSGYAMVGTGHLALRGCVSVSEGIGHSYHGVIADEYSSQESGYSSGPINKFNLFLATSALPTTTGCAVQTPPSDYLFIKDDSFVHAFANGAICGPGLPGYEFRTKSLHFFEGAGDAKVAFGSRDTIVWDEDGSVTDPEMCYLHGCYLHGMYGPETDKFGGRGHLPFEACSPVYDSPKAMWCNKNVQLKTYRWVPVPFWAMFKVIGVHSQHGYSQSAFQVLDGMSQMFLYVFTMFHGGKHKIVVENVPPSELKDLASMTGQAQGLSEGSSYVLMYETLTNPDHFVVDGNAQPLVPSLDIKGALGQYTCEYDPNAYYEQAFETNITNNPNLTCMAPQDEPEDGFPDDDFAGWYDLQRCGKCNDYCRWVGLSASGGDPALQMVHGSSYWSCRLSGSNKSSRQGSYTMWNYNKCDGKGAVPPWKLKLPAGTDGFYSDNPMSQDWFCQQMQLQNIFPKYPNAAGGSYIYMSASETHNMNYWHPGVLSWTVSLNNKSYMKNLAGSLMDGLQIQRPGCNSGGTLNKQPAVGQSWKRIEVDGGTLTRVATNAVTVKNVRLGMYVARGRDWEWGDEDGGMPANDKSYAGEVTAINKSAFTVTVSWTKKEWQHGMYLLQTDDWSTPLDHYRIGKVVGGRAKYDLFEVKGTVQTRAEYLAAQCGIKLLNNKTTYRWSNASAWPGGRLPTDEDNVTIPYGTTVILDVNSTAMLNELHVHGKLIFDDSGDRLVSARYFVIGAYTGVVEIGSKTKPFMHKATILLRGHRMTPQMRGVGRGSKFILVRGQLNAFGSRGAHGAKLTRLLTSTPKGSTALQVDAATAGKLKIGDQIIVTSTNRVSPAYMGGNNQNELMTVASISVSNQTATLGLAEPLQYAHKGMDDVPAGTAEFKGALAAYIALALPKDNIKIESEDTLGPPMCGEKCPSSQGLNGVSLARMATRFRDPAWLLANGCRPCKANTDMNFGVAVYVVPTAGSGPTCPRTVGSIMLDSVTFHHCGQRNYIGRGCVHFHKPGSVAGLEKEEDMFRNGRDWIDDPVHKLSPPVVAKPLGPAVSAIVNCSFMTGYMGAITVDAGVADQPVSVKDNVMYGLRQHGIGVSSDQANVENNLVAWVRDFNNNPKDGVWAYGMLAYGAVARNNVFVGMELAGAVVQTEICGTANLKITKNVVAGAAIGVLAQSDGECAEVNGWTILQTTGSGFRLEETGRLTKTFGGSGATFNYVKNLFIDNRLALSHMKGGANGRGHSRKVYHASIKDSIFVGGSGSIGVSTPSWPGIMQGPGYSGINQCSAANKNGPVLYGSGSIVNCRFINFKKAAGASVIANWEHGTGSWGGLPHWTGQHYQVFVKGITLEQVDEEAKFRFARAGFFGGMATMSIGCAQFDCDGWKATSIVDEDGSLIGGSGGTVVGRNEQDFYKRLKYVDPLGFESMEDLIPFAQRYDMNGKAIPLPLNISEIDSGIGQHAKRYGRADSGFGKHVDTTRSPELIGPVYQAPGFYRNKDCTLQGAWNAWHCPGGLHRDFIIEVMDYNYLVRRWAPVTIEVNENYRPQGGFLSMFTGDARYEWTSQDRLSTFHGLGYVGMRHNVYLSGSPPNHIRMHWRGKAADEGIVACFYYGLPNIINVYVDGNLVQPKTVTTWDNYQIPTLNVSMPHGTNFYDRVGVETGRPGYLYVVMKGVDSAVDLKVSHKVKLTSKVSLDSNLTFGPDGKVKRSAYWEKGINGLVRSIALQFGIPPNRIAIVGNGTAKPGTFWNENTTSKSFAEWMWKQNQTMDKMNRSKLADEMRKLRNPNKSVKSPDTPGTPGTETSMLEVEADTARSKLQRVQKSLDDLLAKIHQLETTHQKAVPTELMQDVLAYAEEVRLCNASSTMERLHTCLLGNLEESDVAEKEARIKAALNAYFADKANIAKMVQWQDDNTKGCKHEDTVATNDPCAVGQLQLGGVLEAEATSQTVLDANMVDVVIDDEVPDDESDETTSSDSKLQPTIKLAEKISGSSCSDESFDDCKPTTCPAGETCTPFKVSDLQVDGSIGSVPDGWTCSASKYGGNDGCHCGCGVWDPDCDATVSDFRTSLFGIRDSDGDDIWLLDSEGVKHLLRTVDRNTDFKIDEMELLRSEAYLGTNNRLLNMAKRIRDDPDNFMSKIMWSDSESCKIPSAEEVSKLDQLVDTDAVMYKAMCVKDTGRQVKGNAAGRCAWLPEFQPGGQCLVTAEGSSFVPKPGNPCDGDYCTASDSDTWHYTCGSGDLVQEDFEPGFVFEKFQKNLFKEAPGGVHRRRRRWQNFENLQRLMNDLPANPSSKSIIKPKASGGSEDFFRTPRTADYFVGRVRARFLADVTGNYRFFVDSDDSGLIRIRLESGQLVKLASNSRHAGRFDRYPEQASANVYLEAGTLADLEGLYIEGRGSDYISIGCELPGGFKFTPCPLQHRIMLPADEMSSGANAEAIRVEAALAGEIVGTFQRSVEDAAVVIPDLDHDSGAAGKLTLKFTCKAPAVPRGTGVSLLDVSDGLVLDLRGDKYDNSGIWENQVAGGQSARVPAGVTFDATQHAFQLNHGSALSVNLATSPDAMPEAAYAMWVKVTGDLQDGAWVMSQKPGNDWSRALALNEHRSGGIAISKGGHWNAKVGYPSPGQWVHVVGNFRQHGKCTVFKNGFKGTETICNNDHSTDPLEMLMIGNADVMVSDVKVFNRALSDKEVLALYNDGKRPSMAAVQSAQPVSISFAAEVLAPSEFANSFSVYLDGKEKEAQLWQVDVSTDFQKSSPSPAFMVSPGTHTFTIKGREDNIKIKNLYMMGGEGCEWEVPAQ